MQAIQTKILPATNTKTIRIKAWCERGQVIMSYSYEGSEEEEHRGVIQILLDRFVKEDLDKYGPESKSSWERPFIMGFKGGNEGGFCAVILPKNK